MEAFLELLDPNTHKQKIVRVSWNQSYDVDAYVEVPPEIADAWNFVAHKIQKTHSPSHELRPYSTMPYSVTTSQVLTSATGAFVIANEVSFGKARWLKPPPYPPAPVIRFDDNKLPGVAEDDLTL